jgi:hypothetical protein
MQQLVMDSNVSYATEIKTHRYANTSTTTMSEDSFEEYDERQSVDE